MTIVELWWLSLAVAAVVTVVVAVLLGLIVRAAKSIDEHAAAIWTVGKDIAGNTVSIWMLDKTIKQLNDIARSAQSMARTASSMDEKLKALARTSGRQG